MLFQTLDNKRECYAIYCDGEFYHYPNNLSLTETWDWTCHAPADVDCAQIWAGGKTLKQTCPDHLQEKLEKTQKKGAAFLNALQKAKINLDEICFYELVPKSFLVEYCRIKNEISSHVFENYSKPKNYNFQVSLLGMLDRLSQRELQISSEAPKNLELYEQKKYLRLRHLSKVNYNPYGSVTGRLTTKNESFPILTLPKTLRQIIEPNNDLFVELDYNSAELRTAFALAGRTQPNVDIHEHLREEIYKQKYTRDETKQKIFAWLYNPVARNKKLSAYINKENILDKYYSDGAVNTIFERKIEVSEDKALNYLVQSTTSDMFLRQAIKIDKLLRDTDSEIAFCIHDSLVIDMSRGDRQLLEEIISTFKTTSLGEFKTNVSIGKNFGSMRKVA